MIINGVEILFPVVTDRGNVNFKIEVVKPNGTFELKKGMIALILPYTTTTQSKTAYFFTSDGTNILGDGNGAGATMVFVTDAVNDNNEMDKNGNNHWMSLVYVSGITAKSNHNKYSSNCYFKNNYEIKGTESGYAYVYYLERE